MNFVYYSRPLLIQPCGLNNWALIMILTVLLECLDCLYARLHVCACTYVHMYACIYVCMYVYMYVCVYA